MFYLIKFLRSHTGLLYITFGNILGAAITGCFWLILALIQPVEEYGKTSHIVSLASLASSFALLGLNTTVLTFIPKGFQKINIQANQLILISGFIASVLAALYDWLLGFFVIGMTFWMMSTYELLGKKSYKHYAIVNVGARAIQIVLSLFLYYFLGIPGIVLGFSISFLVFAYQYYLSMKNFTFDFSELKDKMKFSLHVYSFNLSNALLMYFDKIIIAPLFGYAILGYYQLGFQFLLFLGMIPISLFQYLVPEEATGKKKTKLRILGLVLSIVLAFLLYLFSPYIVNNFFPQYIKSIDSIRIMSMGLMPLSITYLINSEFLANGKTRGVIGGAILYQTLQLSLIYYLGFRFETTGLSLAVVFALTGQALFLFAYKRYIR